MWDIRGKPVDVRRFEPFEPLTVLYDFDGPRIFTLEDSEEELSLAYWSDENDQFSRYVIVPTTPRIVSALEAGSISVFEALSQPRCWLCDASHHGELIRCQRVDFEAIPRDALPAKDTLLLPALKPIPAAPATGANSHPGEIVNLEGRIRELDKDRLTFELRDADETGQHTQRFVFDEEMLDEVVKVFHEDAKVRVAGRASPVENVAHALALSRIVPGASSGL